MRKGRIKEGLVLPHSKPGYDSEFMHDQQIHTDRTVPDNKPDIILRHNAEKLYKLIEVSVPAGKNTRQLKKRAKGSNSQDVGNKN